MTINSEVYAVMSGYAPLVTLVGTRIYPDAASQGDVFPSVVYMLPASEGLGVLSGELSLMRHRVVVAAWSPVKDVADEVADAVIAAFAAASVPAEARSAEYDEDSGLYSTTTEFDYWL